MIKPALRWVLACALVLTASQARADISIGASPAFLDIQLEPGKTTAQTILLFNSGPDPVTVRAYAWDWWHEPGNTRKFAPPGSLPNSAAKWVSFVPEEITVSSKKAVNVTVVFNTPPEAHGGNYAVAWFEAVPAANPNAKELRVGARLGVLLMTEVRGKSNPKIVIQTMKITPPTDNELLRADVDLANTGDIHLFPKGTLMLMDKNNKLIGHTGFEKKRMLPGEKAPVTINWGDELAKGDYQAILTVDYGESSAVVKTEKFSVK